MTNEEQIGRKIISYMGKDPQVSPDISARLEFARNQALKKIKQPPVAWYKKWKFDGFQINKIVLATSAVLALLMISFSSETMRVEEHDNDDITYHMEADKLPSYIVDDI